MLDCIIYNIFVNIYLLANILFQHMSVKHNINVPLIKGCPTVFKVNMSLVLLVG